MSQKLDLGGVGKVAGRLVEQQIQRWEAARRAAEPESAPPCIAISRQPASGGRTVAQKMAEWLDYGLFDKAMVDTIANERSIQSELVAGLDEQVRSALVRYVTDSFRSRRFNESDYLRSVGRTVAALGERGMVVIVGRGAGHILPPERTLHVRVVAPREWRVERFARRHGVDASEAEGRLDREDALRSRFLKHQFGVDPEDATLYDLVVNTGTLEIEGAGRVGVEALRRRFKTPGK